MEPKDIEEPDVKEVMNTEVAFVEPDISVREGAKKMKNRGIGSLVVKKDGEIKGIVTNSDIVNNYVVEGKGETVEDIMSTDLVTISPNKKAEDAALIMVKKGIERLPVMEDGNLVGIISTNDIIMIQPSLYLELLKGLKIGEESFEVSDVNRDVGRCESCENYSENLEEVNGQMLCEECREGLELV